MTSRKSVCLILSGSLSLFVPVELATTLVVVVVLVGDTVSIINVVAVVVVGLSTSR